MDALIILQLSLVSLAIRTAFKCLRIATMEAIVVISVINNCSGGALRIATVKLVVIFFDDDVIDQKDRHQYQNDCHDKDGEN